MVYTQFTLQDRTHQGALQVEGLGVLTQQHHVLLKVVQAAVLVAPDPLLVEGGAERKQQLDTRSIPR